MTTPVEPALVPELVDVRRPWTVSLAQASLMRALMQAQVHVDDDTALREIEPFMVRGKSIEVATGKLGLGSMIAALLAGVAFGGRVASQMGIFAGVLSFGAAVVVVAAIGLAVVGGVQKRRWRALAMALEARMKQLGWDKPGVRRAADVIDGDVADVVDVVDH